MSPGWQQISFRLATALRAMPCRCEKKWEDGKPDQVTTKRCSRCIALEMYDFAVEREAA